ncbi:MAG: hypothetical protein A3J58_02845 [Candidatus Sungbacteria bacterium RIFCSPHIGHO2_02_FULL_52_23]|uniref:HAD family hydrolase n=1 Tax=Candidatus Sungbacteria bacterium RIFCSPHIGHO2_02_FULL_52_23 TaxID=1802274 RepID=A0A1G2KTH4_9BACT|nr:MAG: hypothetical protein A3J58_02845 [Candidatus Sungbacteria bacterium RIFCSPHIGHO2_02_FULL_52_23]
MNWKAIIFDMDGVVIDSERLYDIADAEFFQAHGKVFEKDRIVPLIAGKSLMDSTAIVKEMYNFEGDVSVLTGERRKLVHSIYGKALTFIKGFSEFHHEAIRHGITTCIATASDDTLLALADRRLGLSEIFGAGRIFKISDVGNKSKPDPAIFLYAAERLGFKPAECVVIEDAPNGVAAAKNAGMYCIALTTTRPREELGMADVVLDSYQDIKNHLLL